MERTVAWVLVSGFWCLVGTLGCSGGCGCGEEKDQAVVQQRVPIGDRTPKKQPARIPPKEYSDRKFKVKDLGIQTVGEATGSRKELQKKLESAPAVPGAALQLSGVGAPTEAETMQPHLQKFKPETRSTIVRLNKMQNKLPPPADPEELEGSKKPVDEEKTARKYRHRRRR